jgi:hypothetical protein
MILDGANGTVEGMIAPVDVDELEPQLFEVTTETDPVPVPILTVADVVPCPLANDQPVPETVHS